MKRKILQILSFTIASTNTSILFTMLPLSSSLTMCERLHLLAELVARDRRFAYRVAQEMFGHQREYDLRDIRKAAIFLFECKNNLNAALWRASQEVSLKNVQDLLRKCGANSAYVLAVQEELQKSNIHEVVSKAIENEDVDVLKLLKDVDALPSILEVKAVMPLHLVSSLRISPLMYAVHHNKEHIVQLLLTDRQCNVNYEDEGENTALLIALKNRNKKIVNLLLRHPHINISMVQQQCYYFAHIFT